MRREAEKRLEFRPQGAPRELSRVRAQGLGFRAQGLGLRAQGHYGLRCGARVEGSMLKDQV